MRRVKKRAENLSFIKTKISASGSHHYSANRRGKCVETVTSLIIFGSIITENGDCSYQIKCHLLLDVKAMINIDIAL